MHQIHFQYTIFPKFVLGTGLDMKTGGENSGFRVVSTTILDSSYLWFWTVNQASNYVNVIHENQGIDCKDL